MKTCFVIVLISIFASGFSKQCRFLSETMCQENINCIFDWMESRCLDLSDQMRVLATGEDVANEAVGDVTNVADETHANAADVANEAGANVVDAVDEAGANAADVADDAEVEAADVADAADNQGREVADESFKTETKITTSGLLVSTVLLVGLNIFFF